MRFAHTNIISQDWKALSEFYCNVFGCEVVLPLRKQEGKWLEKGTGVPNARLEGVHLKLPGFEKNGPTLEIYQYGVVHEQVPIKANRRGFGHIAFEVEYIEEVLTNVISNGGSREGELTRRNIEGVGELSFIYVRDPEGNLIELQMWI